MTELVIKYGKDLEAEIIRYALTQLERYKRIGAWVTLPEGVTAENTDEVVEREFKIDDYRSAEKELRTDFDLIKDEFCRRLEAKTGGKVPETLNVNLTKYGCGGSYWFPNNIEINLNGKTYVSCLKHELTHLLVEDYVRREGLSDDQKEALVEGICKEVDVGNDLK